LLKIDSALALICFAGRDDADDFFFVILSLPAIDREKGGQTPFRALYRFDLALSHPAKWLSVPLFPRSGSYSVPSLFALCDAIFSENCQGIVKNKRSRLKTPGHRACAG
jgi:hypothetical protein